MLTQEQDSRKLNLLKLKGLNVNESKAESAFNKLKGTMKKSGGETKKGE